MSAERFQTLDLERFGLGLTEIHQLVGGGSGRVEVTKPDCDHACVLISKAELESLERALQLFSETAEFQQCCRLIEQVVATCDGVRIVAAECERDTPASNSVIPEAEG